jgi:hypothetical protein
MHDANERKQQLKKRMRMLNRVVLGGVTVFLPIYIGVKLTGGSADKIENITNVFAQINNQVSLTVPPDGVRYMHFFHGSPDEGHKFVLVDVNMQANLKLAWSVVPRCYQLVDDNGRRYYPLARSPFFIKHSNEFQVDKDQVFAGRLLFEIPAERKHVSLLFDRYKESEGTE